MAVPFSLNPPIGPVPAAGAWIYNQFVQSGNTHTNTTLDTLAVGTGMLMVGQPVSGTGIPGGTTIASITNNTTVVLSQAATATAGITVTFGSAPNYQTAFSNNGNFALPLATLTDVPGCDFDIPEVQALNAGSTFVPAPGGGFITLTSGTTAMTIQLNINGTWTTIFTGTASATAGTYLAVDGGNVRINCPTTAGSFTFYRYRQQPVL